MPCRPSMATVTTVLPALTSAASASRSSSLSSVNDMTSPTSTMNTTTSPVFSHLTASTDPDTEAEVTLDEDLTNKAHYILTNVQAPDTRPLIKKYLSPRLDTRASCLDNLCLKHSSSTSSSPQQGRRLSAPASFRILDTHVDTRQRKVWVWSELEPDEEEVLNAINNPSATSQERRGSKQARIDMMAFDGQGLLVWAVDCSTDMDEEDEEE